MNFLAHFLLSHQTPELVVGSFLGDFVRGKRYQTYDPAIARGILLHREIDRFTDVHPVFRQSKRRLVPQQGHYAGVVVDVLYDHLLARHWTDYSKERLPDFAERIYATLREHHDQLPPLAQRVFGYMESHNWLANYVHPEAIARTLSGMQRRARFPNQMGQAAESWPETATLYAQEFHNFFPQVQAHVVRYLANPARA
ncbi:MAG: ACP phosphodiesterase [Tunicatimonas sp.]